MGMFLDGLRVHNARLFDSAGTLIIYHRGSIQLSIQSVVGSTDWSDESTNDAYQQLKSVDFILKPTDLNIAGNLVEPSRGDQITYAGFKYDLLQTGNGSFWAWSDGFRTFYRIHTSRANVASE